jgi:hypothetical protein
VQTAARKTMADHGFAMFPLPGVGPSSGLVDAQRKKASGNICELFFHEQ